MYGGEKINALKKATETLFEATNDIDLEVNTKKTKCMFILSPECMTKL